MTSNYHRHLGVEEEFHLVDLTTRRLTSRAPEVLAALPQTGYVGELQQAVVESNSNVVSGLTELDTDLRRSRSEIVSATNSLGMGIAASGTVPLTVPREVTVTETPRYRRMLADYQLLAREQLICGTQIHVEIPNRDEAVQIARRVAPYVPTLLAISASSPFWSNGNDTGYASARTLIWQRWPTTGPAPHAENAADYDALINTLIESGVITDPGMAYFDVRPASKAPTLELRVCDSCPSTDTIVLIAGIFRALVNREVDALRAGKPRPDLAPELYRAALWRAARSGIEGKLINLETGRPENARNVLTTLATSLRDQLEEVGDWELVDSLSREAVYNGSSASRQRRIFRRRGYHSDVVDQILAETAGERPLRKPSDNARTSILAGYQPVPRRAESVAYDEVVDDDRNVRAPYTTIVDALVDLGSSELRNLQYSVEQELSARSVTFRVSDADDAQVFPLDLIPRVIDADVWTKLERGLGQRARALNAFITDVYGEQQAVRDGVIPLDALDRAPGFRSVGRVPSWQKVRNHICGFDVVCTEPGQFMVLEDNLRVPSGIAYAKANRTMMEEFVSSIPLPENVCSVSDIEQTLLETLLAAAPPHAPDNPRVVLLSSGWQDSAWFEHSSLARGAELDLIGTDHLLIEDGIAYTRIGKNRQRVDVIYARMDENMLLSSLGADSEPLRRHLIEAIGRGNLAIVNALGNGVADDKAIYAYVPDMIRYYLDEDPLTPQIPTWLCSQRDQRDYVLEHLDQVVVKPIDGFGGSGITIGPSASDEELEQRRRELTATPERFIAQEVLQLSTHPTFDGAGLYPHHVDLRAFMHVRENDSGTGLSTILLPAALTRVAPTGSLVVNSSKGGGGKDTWVLDNTEVTEGPG